MYKLVYPSFGHFAAKMLEENLAKHTLVVGDTVEVLNKVATITGFDVCGDYVTTEGIVRKVGDEHLIIDNLNYSVSKDAAVGGTRNDKHVKYYAPPITNLEVGDIVKVGGETRTITDVGDFMYTLDNGIRLDQYLTVHERLNLNATDMELNDCVTVPKIQQQLANLKELKDMTDFKVTPVKEILEAQPNAKVLTIDSMANIKDENSC